MKKILLVGGGTGGHILPLKNLADELVKMGSLVDIITADASLDRKLIKENFTNITPYFLKTGKIRRYFSFKNFSDIFFIIKSIFTARSLLNKINPDVIFFKGGFVGFPVLIAAKYLMKFKGKIYLHESDTVSGIMTRLVRKYADGVFESFGDHSMPLFFKPKLVVTKKGLKSRGKIKILIFGASQGAEYLNQCFLINADVLCAKYQITLVSGVGKEIQYAHPNFEQFALLSAQDFSQKLNQTDFVVSRAGSSSLFEIITAKKPSLIIPLPSAAQDHQTKNAQYFKKRNLCAVLRQSDKSKNKFVQMIELSIKNKKMHKALQSSTINNSAEEIALTIVR